MQNASQGFQTISRSNTITAQERKPVEPLVITREQPETYDYRSPSFQGEPRSAATQLIVSPTVGVSKEEVPTADRYRQGISVTTAANIQTPPQFNIEIKSNIQPAVNVAPIDIKNFASPLYTTKETEISPLTIATTPALDSGTMQARKSQKDEDDSLANSLLGYYRKEYENAKSKFADADPKPLYL